MIFKLNRYEDGREFTWSQGVPAALSAFAIAGIGAWYTSGKFGSGICYEFNCRWCTIWYYHYIIKKNSVLYSVSDEPVIELNCSLGNTILFNLQGLGNMRLPERHFNITYVPYIKNKVTVKEGNHYSFVDIQLSPGYLEQFAADHFPLQELLMREKRCAPGTLTSSYTPVTTRIDGYVWDLLRCQLQGDRKLVYLQNRVTDLLLEIIGQQDAANKTGNPIQLSVQDIEKVKQAKEYILFALDKPTTISGLSRIVGLNEFKLKKGFKQLYGSTILDYTIDCRMQKAHLLLAETGMSVYEIALATGYKNIPSFSTAFRRKTGYTPGSLRKK